MPTELDARVAAVNAATLTPLVQRSLGLDDCEIIDRTYHAVEGGWGGTYGLYRFRGHARTPGERRFWSLILKILAPYPGGLDPAGRSHWKREALVYRSALLDDLPAGLATPRCFEVVEHPDDEVWMWLEDLGELHDDPWPLARYARVARHLGRFNGRYLVDRPLPQAPWLWTGDLRAAWAAAAPGVTQLPELSRHPLFAGLAPGDTVARMQRIWSERERILAALDRLPRTLCHHDAFRHNLTTRPSSDGRAHAETVLFDWAAAGLGVVGAEIVPLFSGSLRFVPVALDEMANIDQHIFSGYIAGLRDAGWQGDPREVRLATTAIAALDVGVARPGLKWPQVAQRAANLPAGAEPPRLMGPGRAQTVALRQRLLEMGEEALGLIEALS